MSGQRAVSEHERQHQSSRSSQQKHELLQVANRAFHANRQVGGAFLAEVTSERETTMFCYIYIYVVSRAALTVAASFCSSHGTCRSPCLLGALLNAHAKAIKQQTLQRYGPRLMRRLPHAYASNRQNLRQPFSKER